MAGKGRAASELALRVIAPWLPAPLRAALVIVEKAFAVDAAGLVEQRIVHFIEAWRRELRQQVEGQYHPQYLDAQSFTQLLILAIDAVIKERLADKRAMYARLLARADTPEWAHKAPRVEEVLVALIQVSEADLRILQKFIARVRAVQRIGPKSEREYVDRTRITVEGLRRDLLDLTPIALKTYAARLERLGLVLSLITAANDLESGEYVPTHLLEELIALTSDD